MAAGDWVEVDWEEAADLGELDWEEVAGWEAADLAGVD